MIWARSYERRDLLDLLGGSVRPQKLAPISDSRAIKDSTDKILLAWPSENPGPKELPVAIVVPKLEIRDFLAWATTYLSAIRPLTAFARVVSGELLRNSDDDCAPSLHKMENAWIGAIIGEAIDGNRSQILTKDLSVQACMSTYLFCAGRSAALNRNEDAMLELNRRWIRFRSLFYAGSTEASMISSRENTSVAIFTILLSLGEGPYRSPNDGGILDVCRLVMQGKDDDFYGRDLIGSLLGIDNLTLSSDTAAREDRLKLFYRAIEALRSVSNFHSETKSFAVGYLLYKVAPGSIEYMDLLSPVRKEFPGSALWYGMLAGLSPRSDVQNQLDCLGRRIAKEILACERLWDRPRCDISLDELEVLTSGSRRLGWRSANPGRLVVELMPTIYTITRWVSSNNLNYKDQEQADLFDPRVEARNAEHREQQVLLDELKNIFNRGRTLIERLSPSGSNEPDDREMIENKVRRKPEKRR